jgi:hypothetical protein
MNRWAGRAEVLGTVGRGFIPGFESAKIRGLQALRYAFRSPAIWPSGEKHTSGVKTPVPWGCLIAGDESPAYRSRPARFPASRRVGVRGFPGLKIQTWATRPKFLFWIKSLLIPLHRAIFNAVIVRASCTVYLLKEAIMARPRIFVSSTYYDLKYIRASLELFIKSLGFDPILSEKGDIAFTSDRPLDESCYREVENADIFTLIVGGRYGSEASSGSKKPKEFFDRYESITKKEYGSAVDKDIPVFVLIERAVYAEYHTFIRNKDVKGINYAHVDSVNVFLLIEEILAKPRNNPVQMFEKFEDIESWLREQWAGLFRELLRRQSQQHQLTGLSQQVLQLKETNETLKKYLEAVMRGMSKPETSRLIKSEEKRLSELRQLEAFRKNRWVEWVIGRTNGLDIVLVADAIREASSFEDFVERIRRITQNNDYAESLMGDLRHTEAARRDLNEARTILELSPFTVPNDWVPRPRLDVEDIQPVEVDRLLDTDASPTPPVTRRNRVSKKAVRGKAPRKTKPLPAPTDPT